MVRYAVLFVVLATLLPIRSLLVGTAVITCSIFLCSDDGVRTVQFSNNVYPAQLGFTLKFSNIFDQTHRELAAWWGAKLTYVSYVERTWSEAILRGKIHQLNPEFVEWFKRSGLLHILVVSGFHFSAILGSLRQLLLAPVRILSSFNLVKCQIVQSMMFAVNILSGLMALVLLQFLLSTPPAQRAFCCFGVNLIFIGMKVGIDRFVRLQLALLCHALFFPEGLVSNSGILSWLIYLSVFTVGGGLKRLMWIQIEIGCIVAVIFSQFNLTGLLMNLSAGTIGSLMLATAVVPAMFGTGDFAGLRYWNMWLVNHILSLVRWSAELEANLGIQLRYHLQAYIRWLLAVVWCVRLLSKFSNPGRRN